MWAHLKICCTQAHQKGDPPICDFKHEAYFWNYNMAHFFKL